MGKALAAVFSIMVFLAASGGISAAVEVPRITPRELDSAMRAGEEVLIIDVRSPASYEISAFRIKGSVRISSKELEEKTGALPYKREMRVVAYCT